MNSSQILSAFQHERLTVTQTWAALLKTGMSCSDVNALLLELMRFTPFKQERAA